MKAGLRERQGDIMMYKGRNLKPYRGCAIKKDWELGAFGKAIEGAIMYYAYDSGGLVCKEKSLKELKNRVDAIKGKGDCQHAPDRCRQDGKSNT